MARVHLCHGSYLKLGHAVTSEWDSYIVAKKPSMRQAADYFNVKLKDQLRPDEIITDNHIETVISGLNRSWPRTTPSGGNHFTSMQKLIAKQVVANADAFGVEVAPELRKYVEEVANG